MVIVKIILILLYAVNTCDGLRCYSCSGSYGNSLVATPKFRSTVDRTCFAQNGTENDPEGFMEGVKNMRECGAAEKHCMITVMNKNEAFYSIQRDCKAGCANSCKTAGFGISVETCIWCCETDLCNSRDDPEVFGGLLDNAGKHRRVDFGILGIISLPVLLSFCL